MVVCHNHPNLKLVGEGDNCRCILASGACPVCFNTGIRLGSVAIALPGGVGNSFVGVQVDVYRCLKDGVLFTATDEEE